jgi:hypothetical protein
VAKAKAASDKNEPRPTILVRLPAVVEADLVRLEKRLKLRLPQAYRQFLLNYPSILIETKTDLGWCHESLSDRKLRFNIDELIYYNESVRAPGTPWMDDDGPWPDTYFVIGDDQCGNYWVIDVTSAGEAVYFYDHDSGRFQVEHKTIRAFADHLVRSTEKWNKEQGSRRTNS